MIPSRLVWGAVQMMWILIMFALQQWPWYPFVSLPKCVSDSTKTCSNDALYLSYTEFLSSFLGLCCSLLIPYAWEVYEPEKIKFLTLCSLFCLNFEKNLLVSRETLYCGYNTTILCVCKAWFYTLYKRFRCNFHLSQLWHGFYSQHSTLMQSHIGI